MSSTFDANLQHKQSRLHSLHNHLFQHMQQMHTHQLRPNQAVEGPVYWVNIPVGKITKFEF